MATTAETRWQLPSSVSAHTQSGPKNKPLLNDQKLY